MNPTVGEWYTYSWDYDYSNKLLQVDFLDSNGTSVWSKQYTDIVFNFSSSNRVVGFFSYGMNSSYGNPSETIEFKNLQTQSLYNGNTSTTTTIDDQLSDQSISGDFTVGSPITFTVNSNSNSTKTVYYRFSYHPDYGTNGYDGKHWSLMADTEWISDNSLTYTFDKAGKYIVVVWASTDPTNDDPNGISIAGFSVDIGDDSCKTNVTGYEISGSQLVNEPVIITINAENNCSDTLYYRFSYHPDYGTDEYDGQHWSSMTESEWTTENSLTYTFDKAGKYIVVVWASTDPNNTDPNGVSINGFSVEIRNVITSADSWIVPYSDADYSTIQEILVETRDLAINAGSSIALSYYGFKVLSTVSTGISLIIDEIKMVGGQHSTRVFLLDENGITDTDQLTTGKKYTVICVNSPSLGMELPQYLYIEEKAIKVAPNMSSPFMGELIIPNKTIEFLSPGNYRLNYGDLSLPLWSGQLETLTVTVQ
jgi:hypothetical protein